MGRKMHGVKDLPFNVVIRIMAELGGRAPESEAWGVTACVLKLSVALRPQRELRSCVKVEVAVLVSPS